MNDVLDQFGRLADQLHNAVLLVDPGSGMIRHANRAALALDGERLRPGNLLPELLETDLQRERLRGYLASCAVAVDPLPWSLRFSPAAQVHTLRGHRLTDAGDRELVFLELTQDSPIRQRFALLTEQMQALQQEVTRRQRAERDLRRHAGQLESTVAALSRLAEIDSSAEGFLASALDAITSSGSFLGLAFAEGDDSDGWRVRAASGTLEPLAGARLTESSVPDEVHVVVVEGEGAALRMLAQPSTDTDPQPFTATLQIYREVLSAMVAHSRVQLRLRQAQKMEAVGQLTGGIAHDFNNLLAVVLGNAELLLDSVPEHNRRLVEDIRSAVDRGANLVAQLLAFARRQPLRPEITDLNTVVTDTESMIRRIIGEDVDIRVIGQDPAPAANIDPNQLSNSLINLCINARDAMPHGGRLTIETGEAELDRDYAARHVDVRPGSYATISVSDTGAGMDALTRQRAFEPFFTTKPPGKGSGLGLSMVFGFLKQSRGHVKIYSEPGMGTTVRLYLPLLRQGVTGNTRSQHGVDPTLPPGTHVLIVEDDEAVRNFLREALQTAGLVAITAANGQDALELDAARAADVYLIDVVLAGDLSGRDTARSILARHPDAPILFMSGYTENAIVHHGRLDPGVELISKPFRKSDLLRRLAEVVESARVRSGRAAGDNIA